LRNEKRFQDIEELLKAGIDVYTTLNIQHLESLNDLVANISKIEVKERIPDRIFDEADQVELVDIEPNKLLKRMQDGKIYKEKQAKLALENFFR
ncbi:histidine kinase, partial [Campylobacter sp. CH185]